MFLLVLDTSIDVHSHLICNVMTRHLTFIPRYQVFITIIIILLLLLLLSLFIQVCTHSQRGCLANCFRLLLGFSDLIVQNIYKEFQSYLAFTMAFTTNLEGTAHQNIQWQGSFQHMKRDYARLARFQPTLRLCCFHLRSNQMGSTKKKYLK